MADPRARFAIVADNSDLKRKLKASGYDVDRFADQVRTNLRRAGTIIGAAAAAGAAGLSAITISAARAAEQLADTSDKLGIATEQLAALQVAGRLTGVEANKLTLGIQRMTRRIAEAAQGSGEAQDALKELGLDAAELNELPLDEQFRAIAGAMENVTNQADRVRLGFKLFDSEGVDLIRTLAIGSEGLDEAAQKAREYGIALSRVEAEQIALASDAIEESRIALQGVGTQLALAVAPVIELIASEFNESARETNGFRDNIQQAMVVVAKAFALASNAGIHLNTVMDEVQLQGLRLRRFFIGGADANFLEQFFLENTAPGSFINDQVRAALEASKAPLAEVEAEIAKIEGRISQRLLQLVTPEQVEARYAALAAAQKARAEAERAALGLLGGGAQSTVLEDAHRAELIAEEEHGLQLLAIKQEQATQLIALEQQVAAELLAIDQRRQEERRRLNEQTEETIRASKQQTAQLAIGLLQALGVKSRAFAIAAIVLEKALAIQRLLFANRVAAEFAFASQLIPGDPTSLARAAAAKTAVLAQGHISAALIAATGAVQIATLGQGSTGAPIGTPTNPVFTNPNPNPERPQDGRVVEVTIIGNGILLQDELTQVLRNATDADHVFIRRGSRQAQEIRQG